mgnify:FL=1
MRIVNKTKFIRSNVILVILIGSIVIFATNTYSNVETKYKEEYVYTGDTLWSIAQEELENNKYFEGKDIRYVVNELKNVNNLANANLNEGDKLKIPSF